MVVGWRDLPITVVSSVTDRLALGAIVETMGSRGQVNCDSRQMSCTTMLLELLPSTGPLARLPSGVFREGETRRPLVEFEAVSFEDEM